jgi:hypothetical protein
MTQISGPGLINPGIRPVLGNDTFSFVLRSLSISTDGTSHLTYRFGPCSQALPCVLQEAGTLCVCKVLLAIFEQLHALMSFVMVIDETDGEERQLGDFSLIVEDLDVDLARFLNQMRR